MGTSKIVFISGLYIIMGFYMLAFKTSNEAMDSVARNQAVQNQAEQIAMSGIYYEINDISQWWPASYWWNTFNASSYYGSWFHFVGKSFANGTLDVTVTALSSTTARITATGYYGTDTYQSGNLLYQDKRQVTITAEATCLSWVYDDYSGWKHYNRWKITKIYTLPNVAQK